MYDHTINRLPYENPKFHWQKIGIASESRKTFKKKSLRYFLERKWAFGRKKYDF